MPFSLNTLKLFVGNFNQNIENIYLKLGIERQERFPSVIGKFGQNLLKTYQQMDNHAEQADTTVPYITLTHNDENEKAIKTRIHRKNRIKYNSLPALFNEQFPNYNAQIIHQDGGNNKIVVMEGPPDKEAVGRMFKDMRENGITKIFALGRPDDCHSSHFGYYTYTKEPFDSEEFTISSKKQSDSTHIATYVLNIQDKTALRNDTMTIYHIDVMDGNTLDITINELEEIYNATKFDNVAFHCSAGRGRASILSLALMLSREDIFKEEDMHDQYYSKAFLNACKKRIGLCQNFSQFDQIYTFALAFTAFKYGIKIADFPEEFFKLPGAPKPRLAELASVMTDPLPQAIKKPSLFFPPNPSLVQPKQPLSINTNNNKMPVFIPRPVKV